MPAYTPANTPVRGGSLRRELDVELLARDLAEHLRVSKSLEEGELQEEGEGRRGLLVDALRDTATPVIRGEWYAPEEFMF